jgi:hypothetical protein
LLLLSQSLLIGWTDWGTCPNKTEIGHMGASAYLWHTLRFDVFHVNPPLTRIVGGLPVALYHPNYDWDFYSSRPQDRSEWAMGTAFIKANQPQTLRWCFALARWSLIPLLLLGGCFGCRLSRDLYGDSAAFLYLTLWCFAPLALGWGATICPDAAAAALGMVGIYTFRRWLYGPNWTRTAIAGICLGLLPLAKLTWIVAFGLWPLMWCLWTLPLHVTRTAQCSLPLPPLRQLASLLFVGLYVLNMGYLFDGTCRPLGKYAFISRSLRGPEVARNGNVAVAENRFAGTWLGMIPLPLPAEFVQGIDTQRYDFERGLPSYLRGQWSDHGWWCYYVYVALVKMPLGTWCLLFLVLFCALFKKGYCAAWRDEMLVLLPGAALFCLVSSQTGFSAHPRYVLPVLPFLLVWISRVGRAFGPTSRETVGESETSAKGLTPRREGAKRSAAFAAWLAGVGLVSLRVAVVLLAMWSVGGTLAVYPHCLSYFNELAAVLPTLADASYPQPIENSDRKHGIWAAVTSWPSAGPRNGPRHLLDSNIDWGQDLFCLEDWYESHPKARPMKVAYFGGYPLDKSKIKSAGAPPSGPDGEQIDGKIDPRSFGPVPGWYALSVTEIYGRSQQYRYFLNFQPVAMAGYSIYIYHITLGEANRVRRNLGLPELKAECVSRQNGGAAQHSFDNATAGNLAPRKTIIPKRRGWSSSFPLLTRLGQCSFGFLPQSG